MKIKNIKKTKSERVYDITVNDAHHYFLDNGIISHNSGLKYAANNIITLGKAKEKDADGTVTGAIIRCKVMKSRLTREAIDGRVLLSFDKGLDRFYGLLDVALEHKIFEKVVNKIKVSDGTMVFEKAILKNPEKFFTEDILKLIDIAVGEDFKFGTSIDTDDVVEAILLNE